MPTAHFPDGPWCVSLYGEVHVNKILTCLGGWGQGWGDGARAGEMEPELEEGGGI